MKHSIVLTILCLMLFSCNPLDNLKEYSGSHAIKTEKDDGEYYLYIDTNDGRVKKLHVSEEDYKYFSFVIEKHRGEFNWTRLP